MISLACGPDWLTGHSASKIKRPAAIAVGRLFRFALFKIADSENQHWKASVTGARRRRGRHHHGIHLQFAGERHRIALSELAGGRTITIYGQTEVVKDLIAARLRRAAALDTTSH